MNETVAFPNRYRRAFLTACAGAALAPAVSLAADDVTTMGFGFSLYGMRSLPPAEAAHACAEIGYDCVELPVMEGWPADAMAWPVGDQDRFRGALQESGLRLSALMENLPLAVEDVRHDSNLKRLAAAGKIAKRISPAGPRIVETVLGGRPDQWESNKDHMAARLRDWAKAAEDGDFVLAIKAHVGGALHTPEDAVWLAAQAESGHVNCAYDYSHFQLRGFELASSIRRLVPHSVFIHIKDAQGNASRVQFLLPGEGEIDYAKYLRLAADAGYRGDVVVEVSGQIHGKPGYDPIAAARRCYANVAPAFDKAGIRRG
ncbi:MAG: sugar phosphate isomerase/epimerase [Planctomycetes bacterium]|nr:sugar phosphate isomerase/epimerase [Planctomycetota bacterium]